MKLDKHMIRLIHVMMFLSVLFIGADTFSIKIVFTFKIAQIFLLVTFLLLILTNKYKVRKDKLIIFFLITSLFSVVFSLSKFIGISYYLFILFNVFIVYYVMSSYVELFGLKKSINLVRLSFFCQFAILILQYILVVGLNYEIPFMESYGTYKGVPRFRLWYYEPSYMATYVLFWLTIALAMVFKFKDKKYIKDIVCSILMLLMSTSSSGLLGICFAVGLVWLAMPNNRYKLLLLICGIIGLLGLIIFLPDLYSVFFLRIFSGSLNDATGGRVEQWNETFQVFLNNPIFGVGPGNYGFYFGKEINYVPSNVTLELLATLGIFGLVFYMIHLKLLVKFHKIYNYSLRDKVKKMYLHERKLLIAISLGSITFLVILQINQGYLRLYHWMILGLLYGGINQMYSLIKKSDVMEVT